jgi:hypothetical protein
MPTIPVGKAPEEWLPYLSSMPHMGLAFG